MENEEKLVTRVTKDGKVLQDCPDWVACQVNQEMPGHLDPQGREETGVKEEEEVHQAHRVQTEMLGCQALRVHLGLLEMTDDRVLQDLPAHLVHQDILLEEVLLPTEGLLGVHSSLAGPKDPIRCLAMIQTLRRRSPMLIWCRSEKQLTVSKYLLEPKTRLHVPARNWHSLDQN